MFRIIMFYIPLGTSALMAALTHVIINGVLARSEQPDVTISSYAVALSLSFLLDLPMNVLRQTSSKYSRDRVSFRTVARLSALVAGILLAISIIIGWSPMGRVLFRYVFGVPDPLLDSTVEVYQVLAFLYVFTSIRSLFQGIIINQLRTGWMIVGMVIRLAAMFAMSWYFIRTGWVNDGKIGAWIFIVGVLIECIVTVWEGIALKNRLPEVQEHHSIEHTGQLLSFYMPLLYSSLVIVLLNPFIQKSLNMSANPTLAVASYAVAIQLANMIAWFCGYVHQIVLQFYTRQPKHVWMLVSLLSLASPAVLLTFSTDAGGGWLLQGVLGVKGALLEEVQMLLRYLSVHSFLFPWLDFVTGLSMLRGHTKAAMFGKFFSVGLSIGLLIALVFTVPELNGRLAGIVTAVVAPLEIAVVYWYLRRLERQQTGHTAA